MKIIIILMIVLLLIAGCTTTPSVMKSETPGIKAEIVNPKEGKKVYSENPFNIKVKLSNEGEAEAEGETCVFGTFLDCECQSFELEGVEELEGGTLEGEKETLTFGGGKIEKTESSGIVTAKTRYNYKTYGIIKACINKDDSEEGCKIGKIKTNMLSSPIKVTEVIEEIIPETDETVKLMFTIEIKNIGEGNLYSLDWGGAECETPEDLKKEINVMLLNAPGKVKCNPVELRKDEATAHCTVSNVEALSKSYETDITLELEYAYETTDSNQFEVV